MWRARAEPDRQYDGRQQSEGAGRHSRKDKRRHYAIARGSAMESAAALDLVLARRLADEQQTRSVKALYVRIVQMLTKLDAALA